MFNKSGMALKDLMEAQGEAGTVAVIEDLLEKKKLTPEDFSIREIWEACCEEGDIHEAITAASFPKLTGALINSKMIMAYEAFPKVGKSLVQTIKSTVQKDTFAGVTANSDVADEVGEGMKYNDSSFTEKYVNIDNVKFGKKIALTEEAIFFDKTGALLREANKTGEGVAVYEERKILRTVMDLDTLAYQPSGVPTAFYAAGNNNLITANAFNEAGLEAVMVKAQTIKDDALGTGDGNFINIDLNNATLLIPIQLQLEAWQMTNSALVPESAENAKNFFQNKLKIVTSPYVTNDSATTWYWGNFEKDFVWTEVWPMQVLSAPASHDSSFDNDIKAIFKARAYGGCGALDYKHSFKCTS